MFGLRIKNTLQVEIGETVIKMVFKPVEKLNFEKKPLWAQIIQKCEPFYIILKFKVQPTEL